MDPAYATPADATSYGVMISDHWVALRNRMEVGMMFLDENDVISTISKDKLESSNCLKITDVDDLLTDRLNGTAIWQDEDSDCNGAGIDYSIIVLRDNAEGGAALYQFGSIMFDTWSYPPHSLYPNDGEVSYEVQDELLYFLK